MVRILSFFIASLAATCSVLAAPAPGVYEISIDGSSFLTLRNPRAVATFEPTTSGSADTWIVEPSGGQDEVTVQSDRFRTFLGSLDTQPGTRLEGLPNPSSFIAVQVEGSENQYIVYPSSDGRVAVGTGGPPSEQVAVAVWQSTDSAPPMVLTFTPV